MSAIAGLWGETGPEKAVLPDILNKMEHRGRFCQEYYYHDEAALGLGRADYHGVESMAQALVSKDGNITLVCDGDMPQLSDDEDQNLMEVYEKDGIDFVRHLEGPFAILILDERGYEPVFLAARDALGGKPLYYAMDNGQFLFSSEMKSLREYHQSVRPFPPGHYYQSNNGFVRFARIEISRNKIPLEESNQEKTCATIRTMLTHSVARSLEGEQSVGLMISGGLDSSLVAALVRDMDPAPRKSFCVGSPESSDLAAARQVAEALGTEHHEYEYSLKEMLDVLPKVIYYLESFEPSLVRSSVPNYFAFKMASEHCDVVLSGEGADELFSGYAYLKEIDDPVELDRELIRVINNLHHIGLQRGDRMSAANGIEVRMPFLDKELMAYALSIPVEWKLRQTSKKLVEKWILREAFHEKTQLPARILWRDKEEFSEGSGAKDYVKDYMEDSISNKVFHQRAREILDTTGIRIRSKEELYYYQIFKAHYPEPELACQVGRWADC